jgi:hypothetical protein
MVNWFGPAPWDAPICQDCPRCDIPIGVECERCGHKIFGSDQGITMPFLGAPGDTRSVAAFHLHCHLKSVLPHRMWAKFGLLPSADDGMEDNRFECKECRVVWTLDGGWQSL